MLGEMLSVNHSQTFSFFLDGLQETTKKEPCSQRFYYRVGRYSSSAKERDFFGDFAEVLPQWTHRCCRLSRYLREKRLLIRMDQ